MTKQELYLSLYQIIGNFNADARLDGVTDFDRNISVNVACNSNKNISLITMEFIGIKSRYLCSIIFDGNGDQDTCFENFAMPKVKLNGRQRSLALLACLSFLIDKKVINASMEYFAERLVQDHRPSTQGILRQFVEIRGNAQRYCHDHPELFRMASVEPTPESLTNAFTF